MSTIMMFEAFGFMRVFLALQKPISATFGQSNFGYLCLLILNPSKNCLGSFMLTSFLQLNVQCSIFIEREED